MRICDDCGIEMAEGFVIGGGEAYFCNDHEPPYFLGLYAATPDGDTYWTQWEGA